MYYYGLLPNKFSWLGTATETRVKFTDRDLCKHCLKRFEKQVNWSLITETNPLLVLRQAIHRVTPNIGQIKEVIKKGRN